MISGEEPTKRRDGAGAGGTAAKGRDAAAPQSGLPSCAAEGTQRCTGCKSVHYCSQAHQLSHWKAHKVECRRGGKAKRASVEGRGVGGAGGAAPEGKDAGEGGGGAAGRGVSVERMPRARPAVSRKKQGASSAATADKKSLAKFNKALNRLVSRGTSSPGPLLAKVRDGDLVAVCALGFCIASVGPAWVQLAGSADILGAVSACLREHVAPGGGGAAGSQSPAPDKVRRPASTNIDVNWEGSSLKNRRELYSMCCQAINNLWYHVDSEDASPGVRQLNTDHVMPALRLGLDHFDALVPPGDTPRSPRRIFFQLLSSASRPWTMVLFEEEPFPAIIGHTLDALADIGAGECAWLGDDFPPENATVMLTLILHIYVGSPALRPYFWADAGSLAAVVPLLTSPTAPPRVRVDLAEVFNCLGLSSSDPSFPSPPAAGRGAGGGREGVEGEEGGKGDDASGCWANVHERLVVELKLVPVFVKIINSPPVLRPDDEVRVSTYLSYCIGYVCLHTLSTV